MKIITITFKVNQQVLLDEFESLDDGVIKKELKDRLNQTDGVTDIDITIKDE